VTVSTNRTEPRPGTLGAWLFFLALTAAAIAWSARADFSAGRLTGTLTWQGVPVQGPGTGTIYIYVPDLAGAYISPAGGYDFNSLAVGPQTVHVYGNGCQISAYEIGQTTAMVVGGATTVADIDLTPTAGRIVGTIHVNGSPLPYPQISIPAFCGSWQSTNDGAFAHLLPPGTYTANVAGAGGTLGSFPFTVVAGETTDVGTVSLETSNIEGTLLWNGSAVTGPGTSTIFVGIPSLTGVYIHADGTYHLVGLPPGTYTTGVFGNGCFIPAYQIGTATTAVAGGETKTADIDLTSTAGRVTGTIQVNGAPLPYPAISIPSLCGSWQSDSAGAFHHFLAPGKYVADVAGNSGKIGSISFDVVAGQTTDLGTVNLLVGDLAGTLLWNGAPVSGPGTGTIYGYIAPIAGQYLNASNGTYHFNALMPGSYTLAFFGNGCSIPSYQIGSAQVDVVAETVTAVDLDITATAGRVTGRVTVNGTPLPYPNIFIPAFCGSWQSFADGTFLHFLPPGDYTATVAGNSGPLGTVSFTVVAGQTTRIDFGNLPPAITAGSPIARTAGTAGTPATIATVSDIEDAPGTLTVTAISVPTGISLTSIANGNGTVTATVAASCAASPGANVVTLRVEDSAGATATADLTVDVTANPSPSLGSYADVSLSPGGSATVTPSAAPADNGSVSVGATASPGFTGTLSADSPTGAVSVGSANSGSHTITVTATDNCGATSTRTFTVSVGSPLDHIVIAPASALLAAGTSQAFTATAFDGAGHSLGDVTSNATFSVAPNGSCTGASCGDTVAGPHTVTATYQGFQASASVNVTAAALDSITISPSTAAIAFGQSQPYMTTGFDAYGNSLGDTTSSTAFSVGPDGSCAGATCTPSAPGPHTVTANRGGKLASASLSVSPVATSVSLVSSFNPSVAGTAVTFTATVIAVSGTPTGTVQFTDGAAPLGSVALSGGIAHVTTSTLSAGSHSIVAAFTGDSPYGSSASSTLLQQVNPSTGRGTTTTLSSAPNPSVVGSAVTLTATVSTTGGGKPAGIVTFSDGALVLGSASLGGNGKAALVVSTLAFGGHELTASYSGSASFDPSISAVLTHTVLGLAAVSLLSAPNPSNVGQLVTFTATVTGGATAPTGIVTFYDGSSVLGTAPLDAGGSAMLSTTALSAANHSIKAVYGGDGLYAGASSPILHQNVKTLKKP
jgi:hypothetical protein